MKFHKQINSHAPAAGKIGDCFRTALACLLDLEPQEVPHFLSMYYTPNGVETKEMKAHIRDWLSSRGYALVEIPYTLGEQPVQELMDHLAEKDGEDMCYLLSGMSTNAPHVVIARGSKILWDPSPTENGIVAPIDGVYWVSYLVPLLMRYNP